MTGSLQVKNDKYYAVLNFRDSNGKRVQKWIHLNLPVKDNKRRAEIALNELLVQYQDYENIEPMNLPVSQLVANWLEANRPNIAVTTYDQYFLILTKHIRPYFDNKRVTVIKLTAGDLEDYYAYKLKDGLSQTPRYDSYRPAMGCKASLYSRKCGRLRSEAWPRSLSWGRTLYGAGGGGIVAVDC